MNMITNHKNVLGEPLKPCCNDPLTGFYRNGFCQTGVDDVGNHIICTVVTEEFLAFSQQVGNDLSTPRSEYRFPGLKPGDKWCVCITRWIEAYESGVVAQVVLEASHEKCLDFIDLSTLKQYQFTG